MSTALADTSFVLALLDADDTLHAKTRSYYLQSQEEILLPAVTLPEIAFHLHRAGGTPMVQQGMQALLDSQMQIVDLVSADYNRMLTILRIYADSRIDFVDGSIMALAERLDIAIILTYDRRDFGLYRPTHRDHFDLRPW